MSENPNCDISQYVLEQQDDKNGSFYTINMNLDKNNTYKLTVWLNSSKKCNLINIKSNNNSINTVKKLIDKKEINKKNWYKYEFIFSTNNYTNINITLGTYKQIGTRYFTDIILLPYLKNLPNFLATIGLKTFLDAKNIFSCSNGTSLVWNDLSNNNESYKWYQKPIWNPDGYFKTDNNTLTGPSGNKLFGINREFSIIIHSQSDAILNSTAQSAPVNYSLSILNSNNMAIGINIPNNPGEIEITINGVLMSTTNLPIQPQINNDVYTLTFNNGTAKLWINDKKIFKFGNVSRPFFDETLLQINSNKGWDAKLFSFLIYEKELNIDEIKYISNYLKNNKSIIESMTNITSSKNTQSSALLDDDCDDSDNSDNDNDDNNDDKYRAKCQQRCLLGMKNCNTEIKACKKYCNNDKNKNDPICQPNIIPDNTDICPIVYKKNSEFMVYIPQNSKYASIMGSNERSYGSNKDHAHQLYRENFPDCPIPDELQFKRIDHGKCPFSVRKHNPCNEPECRNVDWNKYLHKNDIPRKCGKHVSHYCRMEVENSRNGNRPIDPICECWKPSNIKNEKCIKIRNVYEPAQEYGCNINVFEIEEHPDFKNYIRKDKIPCWNCDLTAPTVKDSVIKTRNWNNV
jgi:hypothetical protein